MHFYRQTQSAPGCSMEGFKGNGLVLHEMLTSWNAHQASKRLASSARVFVFCSRAGYLFTFIGKNKAHPGAAWKGSRERVWFFVECSSGLARGVLIRHQASQKLASSAPSG